VFLDSPKAPAQPTRADEHRHADRAVLPFSIALIIIWTVFFVAYYPLSEVYGND